eukprot:scaffold59109_cov67-Phaeocystis_antarctica.AAC.2
MDLAARRSSHLVLHSISLYRHGQARSKFNLLCVLCFATLQLELQLFNSVRRWVKRRDSGVGTAQRPVGCGGGPSTRMARLPRCRRKTVSHHIRGVDQTWAAGARLGNGERKLKVGVGGGGGSCAEALRWHIVWEVAVQKHQQHAAVCEASR